MYVYKYTVFKNRTTKCASHWLIEITSSMESKDFCLIYMVKFLAVRIYSFISLKRSVK